MSETSFSEAAGLEVPSYGSIFQTRV